MHGCLCLTAVIDFHFDTNSLTALATVESFYRLINDLVRNQFDLLLEGLAFLLEYPGVYARDDSDDSCNYSPIG